MTDTTTPAPRDAADVEEFVDRMRQAAHAELVEQLSKARAQVQAAVTTMARNATMLEEENVSVLEGLAWAEYELGLLAERAERGDLAETVNDDEALRGMYAMLYAPKEEN